MCRISARSWNNSNTPKQPEMETKKRSQGNHAAEMAVQLQVAGFEGVADGVADEASSTRTTQGGHDDALSANG